MKYITPGHSYVLEVYDVVPKDPAPFRQYLFFMKRIGERYPGNEGSPHPGTNCQEVLRALIDRLLYLNNQIPCAETEICIGHARHMILMLEMRAKRVKGKHLPVPLEHEIEKYPTCKVCGHILCEENHQ